MARGKSGLMSRWGQKSGRSKVSLVVATSLKGAVLKEGWVPGLLPHCNLPLISCFVNKTVSHLEHTQPSLPGVFNDALALFFLWHHGQRAHSPTSGHQTPSCADFLNRHVFSFFFLKEYGKKAIQHCWQDQPRVLIPFPAPMQLVLHKQLCRMLLLQQPPDPSSVWRLVL